MKKHYLTNVSVQSTSDMGWHRWLWGVLMMAVLALPLSAQAQQNISGTVKDAKGEALPGASVVVKGTTRGTSTDVDGKYQISATAGEILVATLTGYKPMEMTVGAEATIDFSLEEDGLLTEVVVVGYVTQDKKDITGALTRISEKDLNQGPITSPLQRLTGRAAGVTVTQVGSQPGEAPSIRIRGITSLIGGNDPLVVVDGIQGNMDLFNQIPPSEIESVDILKDASATAIYGSRGAAGVVLVTTKKGKGGRTTVEYSGTVSFETIAKKYEMLTAEEWKAESVRRTSLGRAGGTNYGGNTNWLDEITRGGFTQNHNIAFTGGSDKFDYRASLTAINQEGIIKRSGNENFIGRIQASQRALNDKLNVSVNLNVSTTRVRWNGGPVQGAIEARPTDPIYNADGSYFRAPQFGYVNQYANATEGIFGNRQNNLFTSARAEYTIIDGLTATLFGSWRRTGRLEGNYTSPKTTIEDAIKFNGIASRAQNESDERLTNFILNYRKNFGDKHDLQASFIYEWQKSVYEGFGATGRNFVSDLFTYNNLGAGNIGLVSPGDIWSYKNDQSLFSLVGRLSYTFMNKYSLTASVRRDESSKFGKNYRAAIFPSAALSWRVSQEEFFKNQNIFQELKVRVGYGVTGNQQGLPPQGSVLLVGPSGTTFFNGQLLTNYTINQNANPDLRWETRNMFNAGIDFTVLNKKLTGNIDFYSGVTKNLLFNYTVPVPPYPFDNIRANVGSVLNRGVEINLNYSLIDTDDFGVTLGGNFTSNKTLVQELSGSLPNGQALKTDTVRWGTGYTLGTGTSNNGASYLIKGQPLGAFFLYQHAGVDDQGNQILRDVNGNGIIDDGDRSADRVMAGQPLPKFSYAFTPTVRYKNFDLSFVLRGAYGHKVYNSRRASLSTLSQFGLRNSIKEALDYGIETMPNVSDFWLEDGGFTRLENLTIGYKIPVGESKYVSSARISVTTNNLFVITKYKGIDPEQRLDGSGGFGIDGGIYPRTRNFAIGVNVNFK